MDEQKFATYYDMLIEWNNKFNLTAITDREQVYTKHFLDSLLPVDLIPSGATLIDIGSGAGFPGLPLAIERSDLKILLVDSLNKRINFLDAVIAALSLDNVSTLHSRAEDLDKSRLFDVATARAVAPLATLAEYCLPFVKQGGMMLSYKSADSDEEIRCAEKAIAILGGEVERIVERTLADDIVRRFIIIRKVRPTPRKYPRSGNKPRTLPIA